MATAQWIRGGTAEHPDLQPGATGPPGGGEQVRAAAAGRQQQQHVTGPAVCADLPGEHLVVPEVVADRGQARRLGVQRDRGQRRPVRVLEPADQLGGQVLCLGRATTVAGSKQSVAFKQQSGELRSPRLQLVGVPAQVDQTGQQQVEMVGQ